MLVFAASLALSLSLSSQAAEPKKDVEIMAFHAQRYQDFIRNRIMCEIFGEVKNRSSRPLKGMVVEIKFLDEKGKEVATEELSLSFRVVVGRKARGEARSVKPQEIGNFIKDTAQCPKKWLEGRIQYTVKNFEWE